MRRFIGVVCVFFAFQPALFAEQKRDVLKKAFKLLPLPEEMPTVIKRRPTKRFYLLPNSFSFRPYGNKSLETEGFEGAADLEFGRQDFNFLSFWSVSHIHYPDKYWSWGWRFSPSLNYYSWEQPGKARFLHLIYSAKLLWHFKEKWGSAQLALGAGPIWINGVLFGKEEKKVTFAPRIQLSYFNFFTEKFFVQLKYNKHFFIEKVFKSTNSSLNNFSSIGLYFGYYFSSLAK